ncbi:TetR/AcrR family transcriptional regulator [Rhodococcus gannanensis]|uniref:TetR/AcrR family transcriptional regulator n=1 Tax=Rhodococcus gannanensis TaxID=1960308 RepID=A0ABW4PBZ6_9NOCA
MEDSEVVSDPDLPRSVRLAWGMEKAGARGPKRGLSLERIVDSAVEVAEEEGVGALSMARVAKRLGFTTMSLYRYVASKDELIDLISDRVIGPPPVVPAGSSWRTGLRHWARAEYDQLMRHRWWLQLAVGSSPPTGPNNIAWLDVGLGTLADTPLSPALRFQVVLNTSLFVIGRARFAADFFAASVDPAAERGVARYDYGFVIGRLVAGGDFPHLAATLSDGAFDADEGVEWSDADFLFALDLFLDGVEKLVDRSS